MSYKLKYTDLTPDQIRKIKEWKIPNSDSTTDDDEWLNNVKNITESEIRQTEEAIGVILGDE